MEHPHARARAGGVRERQRHDRQAGQAVRWGPGPAAGVPALGSRLLDNLVTASNPCCAAQVYSVAHAFGTYAGHVPLTGRRVTSCLAAGCAARLEPATLQGGCLMRCSHRYASVQSTARRRACPTSSNSCPTQRQGWACRQRCRAAPPRAARPPTPGCVAPQALIFYRSVKAGVLLGVEQGQGFVIARRVHPARGEQLCCLPITTDVLQPLGSLPAHPPIPFLHPAGWAAPPATSGPPPPLCGSPASSLGWWRGWTGWVRPPPRAASCQAGLPPSLFSSLLFSPKNSTPHCTHMHRRTAHPTNT